MAFGINLFNSSGKLIVQPDVPYQFLHTKVAATLVGVSIGTDFYKGAGTSVCDFADPNIITNNRYFSHVAYIPYYNGQYPIVFLDIPVAPSGCNIHSIVADGANSRWKINIYAVGYTPTVYAFYAMTTAVASADTYGFRTYSTSGALTFDAGVKQLNLSEPAASKTLTGGWAGWNTDIYTMLNSVPLIALAFNTLGSAIEVYDDGAKDYWLCRVRTKIWQQAAINSYSLQFVWSDVYTSASNGSQNAFCGGGDPVVAPILLAKASQY